MRLIIKCTTNYKSILNCVRRAEIRHFAKIVTSEHSNYDFDHNRDETLKGRILLYLDNAKDKKDVKFTEHKQVINLRTCDHREIKKCNVEQLISAFKSLETVRNNYEFIKLLNMLDTEFCIRLSSLQNDKIFKILQIYMKLVPNRVLFYRFYNSAVDKLYSNISTLKLDELIHFIFYVGLQKKCEVSRSMLRTCVQLLLDERTVNNLTKEQICIICHATFKASTKIQNKLFLDKVLSYLNDNLCIMQDAALFATLIKTIRHNRHQTEDLLGTISCTLFFNKTFESYEFMTMCHILALYSDYLYYDKNVLEFLSKRCIEFLREDRYYRIKDIKRFLWSLINLNFKLDKASIRDVIIPRIFKSIKNENMKRKETTMLMEIVLYLWMMEYRAYDLLPYAVTKQIIETIKETKPKENERLNQLLYLIQQDDPLLFKKLNLYLEQPPPYDMRFQLRKRPTLLKVYSAVKANLEEHDLERVSLNCQLPYVPIVGITGYRNGNKIVNIEVLDEYNCLKNCEQVRPNGVMDLKLRLLDKTDEGLIVINSSEVGELSEQEFQEMLKDETRLVC